MSLFFDTPRRETGYIASTMDPLLWFLPLFLLLAMLEALLLARARFQLGDLISGVSCGVLDQVTNLWAGALFLAVYAWVRAYLAPFSIEGGAWGWVFCILAHDLAYYVFHRASHRVNVLWAAHAVHHQSEDYTFAVSLRQGTFATWISYAFYLSLALIGFSVEMFLVVHAAYQVYQFLVHTRFFPRLGPLEWILATPMLHRVHHARDQDLLDKNYGGFFIFWDKLFFSFAPYTREPDYGVTTGLRSWSPYWANLEPYAALIKRARQAPTFGEALSVWLRPPEWRAPWERGEAPRYGYSATAPRAMRPYVVVQLLWVLAAAFGLLYPTLIQETPLRLCLLAFVLFSLFSLVSFFDRRSWAHLVELARLWLSLIVCLLVTALGMLSFWACALWGVWSLLSRRSLLYRLGLYR